MTELAIFAVSSAGVTITVAVSLFVLGRRAANAEQRAGDERARAAALDGKLLSAVNASANWEALAKERDVSNAALVKLLEETSADLHPGGARARLHARWFAVHYPSASPSGVPLSAEPKSSGSDELLKPGE